MCEYCGCQAVAVAKVDGRVDDEIERTAVSIMTRTVPGAAGAHLVEAAP